jgi:hypothetical protein
LLVFSLPHHDEKDAAFVPAAEPADSPIIDTIAQRHRRWLRWLVIQIQRAWPFACPGFLMLRYNPLMATHSSPTPHRLDVESFARLFEDEASLRETLVQLLIRMNREQVTPTHGAHEKGKDIIFYSSGGFGERRLFACVVKNERINGRVDSPSGAGALLAQIEQSFDEPYVDQDGNPQYVDTVYVISPYDILPPALESVSQRLRRIGQVEFLCGSRLLDTFQRYYPSFLQRHDGSYHAAAEDQRRQPTLEFLFS